MNNIHPKATVWESMPTQARAIAQIPPIPSWCKASLQAALEGIPAEYGALRHSIWLAINGEGLTADDVQHALERSARRRNHELIG